jgi:hypothetical protein
MSLAQTTTPARLADPLAGFMTRVIPDRATQRLARRERLPVDPRRSIAVKRDVHEFVVATDPDRFAAAFAEVMRDPAGSFGLIRVKRPADRQGEDFQQGERFQGCYSLAAALIGRDPGRGRRALGWLLARAPLRWVVTRIEDAMLSDYAIIDELVLQPEASQLHQLRYSYLEGTPIRGSSTFTIGAEAGGRCRVTQIFEYQEVNAIALATFQRMGLKMHDQVVHTQIHRAAARAGALVVSGTIPTAYAEA